LHVDVRIARPSDNCAVAVFITAANLNDDSSSVSISVKNESDVSISVVQNNVDFGSELVKQKFEVCIPPNVWTPFGWADPLAGNEFTG